MVKNKDIYIRLTESIRLMSRYRDLADVRDVFIILFFVRYFFSKFCEKKDLNGNNNKFPLIQDKDSNSFRTWLKREFAERFDLESQNFFGAALDVVNFEPYILIDEKKGSTVLKEVLISLFNIPYEELFEENQKIFQDSFDFLLNYFAENGARRATNFYTPAAISELLVNIVKPKGGDRVYDPACGSGGFLVKSIEYSRNSYKKFSANITGRETNINSCLIAKINLFIHGSESADISVGDSLHEWNDNFRNKFDIVLTNPPFSVRWNPERVPGSYFSKFGVPPNSNADFVYILHALDSLNENGKAAIIVPSGVLFRGGIEATIRREIIKANYVDSVIQLAPNLLHGTAIPVNILILNKRKKTKNILFIDAGGDYALSKGKNTLTKEQIKKINNLYDTRRYEKNRSINADINSIASNDFKLLVSLYVQRVEEIENSPLKEIISKQNKLESDLKRLQEKMHKYMNEI